MMPTPLREANEYDDAYAYAIFAQEGYTALMKASVSSSSTRVLDALLAAGANKEATDNKVNGDGACLTARTERRFSDIAGD